MECCLKNKNNFFVHISAFTTVASAVFGRTRFSSHAYVDCGRHTQGTTFTSHASYFDASVWLLLTIVGILQFRSKFYLIFDVCSDSENDSYVMIITGVLAQRYAIA